MTLRVYYVLGQEVTLLINEEKSAGQYQVQFNASNFSSGVFFYRIQTKDFVGIKKLVLMK